MRLFALGLNHRTADVTLRERLVFDNQSLPAAIHRLTELPVVNEAAILSTCNRTELYVAVDDIESSGVHQSLVGYLCDVAGTRSLDLSSHCYSAADANAVAHAFEVASGLDSLVLGEDQILAQVKSAYGHAKDAGATGIALNGLFQKALEVGRKVRTDTGVGRGIHSVGAAAVELASRIFGDSLDGRTVLVLGAGKMSEVTARHLQAHGSPAVIVSNRTYERAVDLAAQLGGGAKAARFDSLSDLLVSADIVICSTSAPHPILTKQTVAEAMRRRKMREFFLIDIAVPRDVEVGVENIENVYLFNIDDLKQVVDTSLELRRSEITRAQGIVTQGVAEFLQWWRSLEVTPLIVAIRGRLDGLRADEMARVRSKSPHLDEDDLRSIDLALQSYENKIAHSAIQAIKSSAGRSDGDGRADLDTIRRAFGLIDDFRENPK